VGVKDPDFGAEMGGWQGYVTGIEGDLVDIAWDSITLTGIPCEQIDRCEEKGIAWDQMSLYASELERCDARDTPEAIEEVKDSITQAHAWSWLGEEGRRIQQVLKDTDPDDDEEQLECWRAYLIQHLTFPFEAIVSEFQEGPLKEGTRITVTGLNEDIDELNGLVVDLSLERNKYAIALCDLRVKDRKSSNYRLINDYSTWFANR
jgi:hypothetical protein